MTSSRRQVRWTHGVHVLLALLLVFPMLLSASLSTPSAPAHAVKPDTEQQRAEIVFDTMTPSMPTREGRITLTGHVRNTTSEPISNLQVLMWRDQSPITAEEGFTAAVESPATTPYGSRMVTEGAFQTLTDDRMPSLAPGEEAPFEVTADVSELELPSTGGVYLIGAHALGQIGGGGVETLGRNRMFMPLPAEGEPASSPTTPSVDLVVLSTQPKRTGSGTFINDSLTEELADGGRLHTLLQTASAPQSSWIIDPALYSAVKQMAEGYELHGGGDPQGQRVAAAWLEDFQRLDPANGFRATYGLPDAAAVAHGGHVDLWDRIDTADQAVPDLEHLPRLDLSGGGRVDDAAVGLLEQGEPIAVLSSTAESEHTLLEPVGKQPIVRFDPDLFTGGPGPAPAASELHRRQRLLAESWVQATNGETEPTVRVITTGVDARAVLAADAPWQEHITFRDLLSGQRFEWSQTFDYSKTDAEREALNTTDNGLGELQADYAAVASLMSADESVDGQGDRAMANMSSSWWRGRPDALGSYSGTLRDGVAHILGPQSVSLAVSPSVTMLARDGSSFPASVQNHLDVPIVVALHFESAQPQRLDVPSMTNIEIPPQGTTTVTVRPEANANGPVQVKAQLATQNGTPLGNTTPILVNATNLGAIGWIIVVASGIVLVLTTALRIRQVRRERARAEDAPAALPPHASGAVLNDELEVLGGRGQEDR